MIPSELAIIFLLFSSVHLIRLTSALCPSKCDCNDVKLVVMCKAASLDVVPITLNPGLEQLYLANNHIKSILSSFTVYRNLEYLDISHNSITSLGNKNFAMQNRLRVLLVGHNEIKEVNNQTFAGLTNLQLLHCNDNQIEKLPPRLFTGLNKLEKVDLSRNRISMIAQEAFSGLINLKTLLLRHNKLGTIPTQSFAHLPNLVKLDVGINSFPEIPEFAFASLASLQDLSLDSCSVASIQVNAFEHLDYLRRLKIQDNNLDQIPTESIERLKNLEELILNSNKIRSVGPFAFRGLTRLRTLAISKMDQLEYIDKDAFLANVYLEKVLIEFNRNLKQLQPGTFEMQSTLKHVSLNGNQIANIHSHLARWELLEYLDVRGNPLNCNCSLLWLWQFLSQSNFTTPEYRKKVLCDSPSSLSGQPLLSVPSSSLDCYETKSPQIVTGTVIVTIICVICFILVAITCRTKFTFFINKKKYDPTLFPSLTDDFSYEKRTIIDGQVICTPATAIMIHPSIKIAPITEL